MRYKLRLDPVKQEEERVNLIKKELLDIMTQYDCQNILEIGCGRAYLRELPGYTGLDFSLETLKTSGLQGFIFADITNHIPIPGKVYDAVLTSAILMHIPPDKIEKACSEISRVTKKIIILNEALYEEGNIPTQIHCFNHNFLELFSKYFSGYLLFMASKPDKIEWKAIQLQLPEL